MFSLLVLLQKCYLFVWLINIVVNSTFWGPVLSQVKPLSRDLGIVVYYQYEIMFYIRYYIADVS